MVLARIICDRVGFFILSLTLAYLLLSVGTIWAQGEILAPDHSGDRPALKDAKSFVIKLESGYGMRFREAKFEEIKRDSIDPFSLYIHSENVAVITVQRGRVQTRILNTPIARHFVELSAYGMNILTIYDIWNDEQGGFLTFYMRHVGTLEQQFNTNFFGYAAPGVGEIVE